MIKVIKIVAGGKVTGITKLPNGDYKFKPLDDVYDEKGLHMFETVAEAKRDIKYEFGYVNKHLKFIGTDELQCWEIVISETMPCYDYTPPGTIGGIRHRYFKLPANIKKKEVIAMISKLKVYQLSYGYVSPVKIDLRDIYDISRNEFKRKCRWNSDDWTYRFTEKPLTVAQLKEWGNIKYINYFKD